MKAIDLYQRLPRENCGKCPQKTCMPFALAVTKGEEDLSACPLLSPEDVAALRAGLTVSDWREELIAKLREELRGVDLASIAGRVGAQVEGGALLIRCMGRPFRVAPGGEVSTHGHMTPWVKILILHYLRTAARERGTPELTGRWVRFGDLKAGMVKATSFLRECEDPLRALLDRDPSGAGEALRRLGAEPRAGFPTEHAWHVPLLPKVPALVLYWPAEEGFPSKAGILFDSSADRFLDVESLTFLGEGLVKNLEHMLPRSQ